MAETTPPEQPITKRRTARQAKDEERWNSLSTLAALDGIKKGRLALHLVELNFY